MADRSVRRSEAARVHGRAGRRRRRARSMLLGSLVAVLPVTFAVAAWLVTSDAGASGWSGASALARGTPPTATVSPPGSDTISVSWTPSATGAPATGYEVRSYEATTGVPRQVGDACGGIVAGTSCVESGVPEGSWRYTVVPRRDLWVGAESPLSDPVVVDRTPPISTITFPDAGETYNNTTWNAGCSSSICGTASDEGTEVASVAVSIRQGSGSYWNGSSFSSATEVLVPATGTTSWTFPFAGSNFPGDGSYTVRAVATDGAGNTASASSTVTIDRTAPAVAPTFPVEDGFYNNTTWNAGCSSSICGTASDEGTEVASVAVSIRQGSGSYWNGSSFSSATEVLVPATGTTSWTFPFAGSNFPGDGSYTVRAVATDGAGNTASASSTVTIDRTAPAVAPTFPVGDGFYGIASWNAGCPSSGICGTASDAGSGVAGVQITLRRGTTTGNYWNGTGFSSTSEVWITVSGTTSWSLPFPATNFPGDGTYRLSLRGTDTAGNTSTDLEQDFTIDVTAPAPTALTLANANGVLNPTVDQVQITFSEPLNVSSICSAWSGTGDQSLTGSGVVVTITDSGLNDVLSVTSSACTLRIGSIQTGRDYVLGTSTFSGTGTSQSSVTWTASTRVLTIRLGAQTSGTLNLLLQLGGTATYSPNAAITDASGNPTSTSNFQSSGQRF